MAAMDGQWIGMPNGTNAGLVVLDLDELETGFCGHAYLFEEEPGVPHAVASLNLQGKTGQHDQTLCDVFPLHPSIAVKLSPLDLARDFQGVSFPQTAVINLVRQGDVLDASWNTNIGTHGAAQLHISRAGQKSDVEPKQDIKSWKEFKEFALDLGEKGFIFRGQDKPYRLRTTFHRTRRKDLIKYLYEDIPHAHHVLTSQTKHFFNLNDNLQNAAFLNLLQHHGYPTPLLDWTYSPFVAAFFAFRFRKQRMENEDSVRIIVFDKKSWEESYEPVLSIAYGRPNFSLIEPLSIENPRALPQQSVSSITNLDDVETYIRQREDSDGKTFLTAVDLPFSERRLVMRELSMMGITAGSLFPGLDGACEQLRGRFFHPFD
jgi:FRG domain